MFKFLFSLMFVATMGLQVAQAQDTSSAQSNAQSSVQMSDQASDQSANQQVEVYRPRRPGGGQFWVQWRDARTGQSISGWNQSNEPYCGHGSNCACAGQNYCGQYQNGESAYYWDQGCGRRPRQIVCDVR